MSNLLINQGTNAAINFDLSGTVNTQVVAVGYGTVNTLGTLPNIPGGTLNNLASGTINAATVVLNSGTINVGTFVSNGGTIQAATVSSLPNLPGGTLNNLASGTINAATVTGNLGTIGTIGLATVSGNVGVSSGTINVSTISTLPNLPGGTLNNLVSGTINSATVTGNLGTMGTLGLATVQMTSGTLNVGTVVNNGGTVAQLTNGSIIVTAGSIVGTQQINPLPAVNTISHAGTSGTTAIGTLVGTASIGAGTALYPTGIRIVAISGTPEVILAFGSQTNGNQVIHHGLYPAGGGIAYPIPYPHGYGTTNSPLTYQILSGAGTVSWDVDYFVHT